MKYLKGNRIISHLFALSSVLLAVACLTITSSFAFPDKINALKEWNVYFNETVEENGTGIVTVKDDRINMNVSLDQKNNIFSVTTDITNDGEFDAVLKSIDITDINNVIIEDSSISSKIYYLSDFVDINIKYSSDNKFNNVFEGNDLKVGDSLNKNTKNRLLISVKLKDTNELTADQIKIIGQKISFSLSIGVNYFEK